MSTLNVGDYNRLGQVFVAANNAATNHIAVATTQTGLTVFNPFGSGKKLILVDWGFVWTTVPGAVHNVGLAMTVASSVTSTGTAATVTGGVRPASGQAAGGASVAQAFSSFVPGSGVAPVAVRWPFCAAWGTASTHVSPYTFRDVIDGAICLVPGSAISTCVVTTTAAGMASFTWIEVPV